MNRTSSRFPVSAVDLAAARNELLHTALDHFREDSDVLAIFLAGSLAADTADEWSDIDLRVVTTPESLARLVAARRSVPTGWPGFLFNEWREGTQHCVSHFAPFGKVDIFYLALQSLTPSPRHALPTEAL